MSPVCRVYVGPRLMLSDVLPYLHTIVQPNMRAVSTQLYSAREKADLYNVINTMLAYSLTYTQERSNEGQYSFVMEPNIEEVVKYTDVSSGRVQRQQMGYTARQLVAREVELERVRRAEAYFSLKEQQKKIVPNREALLPPAISTSKHPNLPGGKNATAALKSSQENGDKSASENVPNHLRKLKAKPVIKQVENKVRISVYVINYE